MIEIQEVGSVPCLGLEDECQALSRDMISSSISASAAAVGVAQFGGSCLFLQQENTDSATSLAPPPPSRGQPPSSRNTAPFPTSTIFIPSPTLRHEVIWPGHQGKSTRRGGEGVNPSVAWPSPDYLLHSRQGHPQRRTTTGLAFFWRQTTRRPRP